MMLWNRRRKKMEQQIFEIEQQVSELKQYISELKSGLDAEKEDLKNKFEENVKKISDLSNGVTYCGNVLADHAYQLQQLSNETTKILHYDSHAEVKLKYLLEKEKPVHPRKIIQVVLDLRYGDAIGNDIIMIHRTLKKWGYDAGIYAGHVHDGVQETAGQFAEIPGLTEDDILLFHFGGYCDFVDLFGEYECKKVLVYHNITPAEFFESGSQMQKDARKGRTQLLQMRDMVDFCIADSEFNKKELENLEFQCPIYVLPIVLSFADYMMPGDKQILEALQGQTNILHVGRIVPNKKIEDIIEAFSEYHKKNPKSWLILAGGYAEMDSYYKKLQEKIKEEKIENVLFTGHIRFEELIAYYRSADVYLCLSEHEGFCVPLLEASFFEIPIIAYDMAAVPETLAGAGVLLKDKTSKRVSAEIEKVVTDEDWKKQLIAREKERLTFFSEQNVQDKLKNIVKIIDSMKREKK